MDPVTHALIGAGISKLAGQPMAVDNPAFVGIVLGAMAPDLDIIMQKWGDYVYLKNHRGISHSIIGLTAFAGLITLFLAPFYAQFHAMNVFLWVLLGCFSHAGIDMLNSYGVKFLWPITNKKIAVGLFIAFDPIISSLLILHLLLKGVPASVSAIGVGAYIILRGLMLYVVKMNIKNYFNVSIKSVKIIPAMVGVFKWHFIVQKPELMIIGEKTMLKREIKVLRKLEFIEEKLTNKIMHSATAKFFAEFTPFYYIDWDEEERTFRFIDVRYYRKNTFLHHATAKVDDKFEVIDQKFHPYSMKKSITIPA